MACNEAMMMMKKKNVYEKEKREEVEKKGEIYSKGFQVAATEDIE
jgi:hypothetical protein